jgi:hypothetical protein
MIIAIIINYILTLLEIEFIWLRLNCAYKCYLQAPEELAA